jgi:hypothetical protein
VGENRRTWEKMGEVGRKWENLGENHLRHIIHRAELVFNKIPNTLLLNKFCYTVIHLHHRTVQVLECNIQQEEAEIRVSCTPTSKIIRIFLLIFWNLGPSGRIRKIYRAAPAMKKIEQIPIV